MRCFLAIDVPEAVRDAAMDVRDELAFTGADVRWVARQNLHLTLRFLGEVAEATMEGLVDALGPIVAEHAPIPVVLDRVGTFPRRGGPRVVWLGTSRDTPELGWLAGTVEAAVRDAGLPPEDRPFVAHLTLGRPRAPSRALLAAVAEARIDAAFTVTHVTAYRSTLTPAGPIYDAIARLPLAST